jgi:Icc-related predicted phosphoesterase
MEARTPWLGLHGHVHESARITGAWMDHIGRTVLLSAAHDGPELAVVRFDLERPEGATRSLITG